MKQLFEKVDSAQLNDTTVISAEDKKHCNALADQYRFNMQFLMAVHAVITALVDAYRASPCYDNTIHFSPDHDIVKMQKQIVVQTQDENRKFIREIEGYFIRRYHIAFEPFEYKPERGELEFLMTFKPYIDHIISQVGTDFTGAGHQRLKDNFRNSFCKGYREPKLQGAKICFTNLVSLERYGSQYYIDDDCEDTIRLFAALGLCLYQSAEIPHELDELRDQWQINVVLGENYTTSTGITFKIYGNGRMDVTFETKEQAKQFWDYYDLDQIKQGN